MRAPRVVVATHSPVVASLPGATVLELDEGGYHEVDSAELSLVDHRRRFLNAPQQYLRHVLP